MTKEELLDRFIFIANHIDFDDGLDMPWKKTGNPTNLDFSKLNIKSSNREKQLLMKFIYDNFYHEINSNKNTEKISNEYWKTAQPYVSLEIEEKWLVQKIYDGGVIQVKKGLISMITWAFEPENPVNSLKKYDFVKVLSSQKFQIINNIGHDRFYGKNVPEDDDNIIRFYWNIKATEIKTKFWILNNFLDSILKTFNQRKIIFSVKLNNQDFGIKDNIVLYVDKRCFLNAMVALVELNELLSPLREDSVPDFTHKIDRGFGFAEEPVNFEINPSFGESRSWEIANFLLEKRKLKNDNQKKNTFEKYLKSRGFDINRFHLNPSSTFIFKEPKLSNFPKLKPKIQNFNKNLDISTSIGFNLCNAAIWLDEKSCTWSSMGSEGTFISTCNSSLSNGTAGIALYLFQLFIYNPDELFYRTAKGAIEHAIRHFDNLDNIGLYEGKSGIMLVIVQVIELLKDFDEYFEQDINDLISVLNNLLYKLYPEVNNNFSITSGLGGYQIFRNYLVKFDKTFANSPNFHKEIIEKLKSETNEEVIIELVWIIISIKLDSGQVLSIQFYRFDKNASKLHEFH